MRPRQMRQSLQSDWLGFLTGLRQWTWRVLRVAITEIFYMDDIPVKSKINEWP